MVTDRPTMWLGIFAALYSATGQVFIYIISSTVTINNSVSAQITDVEEPLTSLEVSTPGTVTINNSVSEQITDVEEPLTSLEVSTPGTVTINNSVSEQITDVEEPLTSLEVSTPGTVTINNSVSEQITDVEEPLTSLEASTPGTVTINNSVSEQITDVEEPLTSLEVSTPGTVTINNSVSEQITDVEEPLTSLEVSTPGTVTINNSVSEQIIYVHASTYDPIYVSLYTETSLVRVGNEITVEVLNTKGWGYRYEVDFGDKSGFIHYYWTDIGLFRPANMLISHTYSDSGVFDMVVNVTRGSFVQTLHIELSVLYAIPSFDISCIPFLTVPPGSMTIDISLDDLSPESPTNASCFMYREQHDLSNKSVTSGNDYLNLTWTDVASGAIPIEFEIPQSYLLSVTCSNAVSNVERLCLVQVQQFTADDFTIDYPRVVGYGRADVQAEVVYTIHLFQDSYIPPDVQFTWMYDDGNVDGPVSFTAWTNTHYFQERGVYNSSVIIEVLNSSSSKRLLPVTVGVLTVESNMTQGMVGVDGLGILMVGQTYGSNITFDIYFGDGTVETCTEFEMNESFYLATSINYNAEGVFNPRVIAISEMFEEHFVVSDVLMYRPISDVNLVLQEATYPPGTGLVHLVIAEDSPPTSSPTNVTCVVEYSDNSVPDVVKTLPTSIQHTYADAGLITVTVECSNGVLSKTVSNTTTVTNSCLGRGLPFRGQKQVTKLFSDRLAVTAATNVICKNLTLEYFWNITKGGIYVDIAQPKSTVLHIRPRQLQPGEYTVMFYIIFKEYPQLIFRDQITVNILMPPLVVRVSGGTSTSTGTIQPITVDAATVSYDPGVARGKAQGLTFSWTCGKADDLTSAENLAISGAMATCPDCLVQGHPGKLLAPPGCLDTDKWHILLVEAAKDVRTGSAYKILHVTSGNPPQLELRCKVNCLLKKNAEFSITLKSKCVDCSLDDLVTAEYQWRLYRRENLQDSVEEVTDLESITSTGVNISAISIKPHSLSHGYVYRLLLRVSGIRNKSVGTVSEFFTMNLPPYRGMCQVTPETGVAALDMFQVSCPDWVDEGTNTSRSEFDNGERLMYEYVLVSHNETSLLYYGDFVKSPPMVLSVGKEDDNYTVEIKARIFDPYNGMTEMKLFAQVTPPIAKDSGQKDLDAVSMFLEDVSTDIAQSVKEGDVQKTSRFTESISSVVNTLILRVNDSILPEDPEDWLRAQPFDVPRGNQTAVPWTELWNDLLTPQKTVLQDKLTKEMESYVIAMTRVMNKTEYLSLETLFYATSSMTSVVKQRDLVSENALETAVNALNQTIGPLESVIPEELSDVRVNEVLSSLLSSVDKMVRAALPTVPVLPKDVDMHTVWNEMDLQDSYRSPDSNSVRSRVKEVADLHDNERAFFLMRAYQEQQYEAKRKAKLAKTVTGSLQNAIDQALQAASKFLVVDQEPSAFEDSIISVTAEKFRLRSLLGRTNQRGNIRLSVNITDPHFMENLAFDFRTTVFQENPFVWDEDGVSSGLTSPALVMDFSRNEDDVSNLEHTMNVNLKHTVSIPNRDSVTLTTVTPRFIPLDRDRLLYHRVELASVHDAIFLFLTSSIPYVKYDVYFRSGEFPTSTEYDYKTDIPPTLILGGNTRLKVLCPERSLPRDGSVYIALRPYDLEIQSRRERDTSSNASSIRLDYGFGVGTVGCKSWQGDTWSSDTCSVSEDSSETSTVCICEKPLTESFTLATSFVVPLNKIDFSTVFTKIDFLNNGVVFGGIISLLVVYTLLAIWARHKDCGDFLKWGITPLLDNNPRDKYVYIVTVSTGMRPGAGTKSRVGVVIAGENEDSGIRTLYDGIREEYPRQSVINYLMTVPYPLGELIYIRVWHDHSGRGDKASWFLHKIVVEDIQEDKRYTFSCGQWLAVDEEYGQIARTLAVSGKDELLSFRNLFNNNIRTGITDSHLWVSVVMGPKQGHFTRLQRLSCCLSLLFLTMIASAMFYGAEDNVVRPALVTLGSFRFSLQQLYVSFISILIVTPVNLGIVLLFRKSKPGSNSMVSPLNRLLSKCCSTRFQPRRNLAEFIIAQRTYSPEEKMLPHWCVYLAWGLLALTVAVPAFFLFLYSQEWGRTKSDEWLTAFILSFFESFIILDPIKMIVLTAMFTIIFRKPDDDYAAKLDKDDLASTGTTELHKHWDTKDYNKRPCEPFSDEAVRRAQKMGREQKTAFGLLREVTFYTSFLVVIFTIAYVNRDNRSFALRGNIYNKMVKRQMDKRLGLENVRSRKDFFQWMNETALQVLFAENYYEGTRRHWRERHFIDDLQNYRVGPPRLRQLRSSTDEVCYVDRMRQFSCQKSYEFSDQGTNDYCVGWRKKPCPDSESVDTFSGEAWTFTSALKIWGLPVWGRLNVYSGGGYISELGVNYQVSTTTLTEEFDNLWLDRRTRAVSLEFTLYNPNVNMFCYVTMLAEFPETGSAFTLALVQPFRAYHHVGALGAYILFNEIIFFVCLLGGTIKLLLSIRRQKRQFFKRFWNVMDLATGCICYVSVIMFVGREFMVKAAVKKFNEDQKKFVNFQHITVWDDLLVSIMGLICFCCTLRMIKILGYNRRINSITSVLRRASYDLLGFSVSFSIIFWGFVMLGYFLFGRLLSAYNTILTTVATLITTIIGKTPFDEMRRTEPILAQIYFASFVFFIVFILLTMFLSILNESITAVRTEDLADANRHRVLRTLIAKLKEMLAC